MGFGWLTSLKEPRLKKPKMRVGGTPRDGLYDNISRISETGKCCHNPGSRVDYGTRVMLWYYEVKKYKEKVRDPKEGISRGYVWPSSDSSWGVKWGVLEEANRLIIRGVTGADRKFLWVARNHEIKGRWQTEADSRTSWMEPNGKSLQITRIHRRGSWFFE